MKYTDDIQDERLIRMKQLLVKISFGKSKIWELVKDKKFPTPKKIGGITVWRERDINQYIKNLWEA